MSETNKNTNNNHKKPKSLILGVGGMKAICKIGYMQVMHDCGLLDDIDKIVGVSASSIIASVFAVGYNPYEMEDLFSHFKFSDNAFNETIEKALETLSSLFPDLIFSKSQIPKNTEEQEEDENDKTLSVRLKTKVVKR